MSDKTPGSNRAGGKTGLDELDRRIAAAREAQAPRKRDQAGKYAAASMAWRMVVELVVSIMVGAAMGWGLDALFGSLPLFLVVFVLLGFAAGVRTMLHTSKELQKNQAPGPHEDKRV